MYSLIPSKRFRKSLKRILRGGKFRLSLLESTLDVLISGQPLPPKYKNHFLLGALAHYEECHIQGDVLLIYLKDVTDKTIVLADIGSHSELFGA